MTKHAKGLRAPFFQLNIVNLFFVFAPIVVAAVVVWKCVFWPIAFMLLLPFTFVTLFSYAIAMTSRSKRVAQAAFSVFIGCVLVDFALASTLVVWYRMRTR